MKKAFFILLFALLLTSSVVEAGRSNSCQNMPQATFDPYTYVLHAPGLSFYPDMYTVDFLFQPQPMAFSVTGVWPYQPTSNDPGGFINVTSLNNFIVEISCFNSDYVNFWLQLYAPSNTFFFLTDGGVAYDYANTHWQLNLQEGCTGPTSGSQSIFIDSNYQLNSEGLKGYVTAFEDELFADFPDGSYFSGKVERGIWNGNYQKSGKTGCFTGTLADTLLSLNKGRFGVESKWIYPGGESAGWTLGTSDNAGMFWFFDPSNTEVVVKVLDGCQINNRYWVFVSSTSNIEFSVDVTDTKTGTVKQYYNSQGSPSPTVQDTDAFATCP